MTMSETSKLVTLSELSLILLIRGSNCGNPRKPRAISMNFTALAPQGINLPVWNGLNDFHTAARYEILTTALTSKTVPPFGIAFAKILLTTLGHSKRVLL